ncbi:WD40 repeat domain-containing protein, partial [Planktothrix sp.]|uniref:WD40 repeat domain-containing protein n=1 Tax=Planktothrix sp. TaxID=3088171 RepID=UPI0038D4A1F1
EIVDVKFNPVNDTIATASKDGTVKLLSLKGELLETKVIPRNEDHELRNISFSPDGTLMAIASNDGTVKLWHPGDDVIKVLQRHESGVNRVIFSPCGTKIASASRDATVIVWNLDGTIYRTLKGHRSGVYDAEFSPDSQMMATFSEDGLKIWHLQEPSPKPLDINDQDDILVIKFTDNKMLASVTRYQTLQLWNIDEGKLVQSQNINEDKENYINVGRFNANGSAIAIANLEPKIKLCLLDLDELMNNSRTWISDYLGLQK